MNLYSWKSSLCVGAAIGMNWASYMSVNVGTAIGMN